MSEADIQKENTCRALIKTGEIPAPPITCSCIIPVANQRPKLSKSHFTVSPSSPRLSLGGVIEHVLSFVGPPGTGKISLEQSIARALGRPSQRIALDGVRDEAEVRGYHRAYVASGPGLLTQVCAKLVVWTPFYYCKCIRRIPEFADLMTTVTAETKSTSSVNRTTTVTHPWHCSMSSIWSKMWSMYVSSHPLTSSHFFSDMSGLLGSVLQRSDRPVPDSVNLHG